MKKIYLLLLLFFSLFAVAQKTGRPLADSLLQEAASAKDDTIKARLYNRIFHELIISEPGEALTIAKTGLAYTQKMNWLKGIGVFQSNLGQYYSSISHYDSAIFFYNASLVTNKKAGNKKGMGITYNNMGVAAQNIKADFTTAADYYFKALQISREEKDSMAEANTLNNIAAIYMLQKDYKKALEFNKKALRLREQTGDIKEMAGSLQSIGKTYLLLKDTVKAKENFQKGLSISEGNGDMEGMAAAWSNFSLAYSTDYRAIAEARIKAKQLWDQVNPMHTEAVTNLGNLGIIYLDIVRYDTLHKVKYDAIIPASRNLLLDKASGYLKTAVQLAEQTGDIDNHSYFKGALAEVQEQQGDFKNAYYNYKFFKEAEDSIYSQESKNKIAEAESRRGMEIQQLALSNQRKTMWGLISGIALVSIIGVLLYRQTQARKRANLQLISLNKELDNANQAKARFFALMSHDLRSPVSKLINFLHLQKNDPDLLTPELKEAHNKKITEGAEALLDNMENMLQWSKSQMEQFNPSVKTVAAKDVFEKLSRSFAGHAFVQFDFRDEQTVELTTDENYLFSILHNLIQNATEVLNKTPAALIECRVIKKDLQVIFTIKDNGPGFPQPLIDAGNTNTITSGKKGLGLFMIHDMAHAIGGSVQLSNTGNGALATVIIQQQVTIS